MKRVLCLISGMNPGGAETFLMKLYRKIDRDLYQMDFCVNIEEEGFYDKEILTMGGRIYHIPSKSKNLIEFKKQLSNIVKNKHYEYVLRITSNSMGFMDLKIAKKAGAKVCAARSSNSNDGEGIKVKIVHFIGKVLYKKYVDVKIAPSELAAIYTFGKKDYYNKNVCILKNAVDLDVYKYSNDERIKIRRELGISDTDVVFGHIGRFSEQKNHLFLINVFCNILKKKPNSKLVLVGTGELEQNIVNRCEYLSIINNVYFLGVRSDIPAILSAMDVFIFPSFYEGMPNTVIEAQATGLPCVISDTITRQANITGLVEYKSLHDSVNEWADVAIGKVNRVRKDTKTLFIQNDYDINTITKKFVNLIFKS